LLHVAQTDEAAAASAEGRLDGADIFGNREARSPDMTSDDLAGMAVTAQRGPSGKEIYERWRAASAAQLEALRACEPGDRLRWFVGELSAVTLATTRLAEGWIHTGDVAAGLGCELTPTGRLQPIARLAWRTLPYAFAQAGRTLSGPVALSLTAPDGTTWEFASDGPAATTVTGPALDFCLVAARRADPSKTSLSTTGPDGAAVLELVRTFA
ncbi:MAG: maleylpyruvate isomerase family mycothiol-dependent enzyme, partial [Actinobacteria bacterium]|nr:maleylpyruvate isomerase family mycothiol-dependent enzyme [Actinomycetota bacterium]